MTSAGLQCALISLVDTVLVSHPAPKVTIVAIDPLENRRAKAEDWIRKLLETDTSGNLEAKEKVNVKFCGLDEVSSFSPFAR